MAATGLWRAGHPGPVGDPVPTAGLWRPVDGSRAPVTAGGPRCVVDRWYRRRAGRARHAVDPRRAGIPESRHPLRFGCAPRWLRRPSWRLRGGPGYRRSAGRDARCLRAGFPALAERLVPAGVRRPPRLRGPRRLCRPWRLHLRRLGLRRFHGGWGGLGVRSAPGRPGSGLRAGPGLLAGVPRHHLGHADATVRVHGAAPSAAGAGTGSAGVVWHRVSLRARDGGSDRRGDDPWCRSASGSPVRRRSLSYGYPPFVTTPSRDFFYTALFNRPD